MNSSSDRTSTSPPPLPQSRSGSRTALVLFIAGILLLSLLVAAGLRFLMSGTGGDADPFAGSSPGEELPSEDVAAAPEDEQGSLEVMSMGAIAPEPEHDWGPYLPFGQSWSPFAETDTRMIEATSTHFGFLGVGVLDESAVPSSSGETSAVIEDVAAYITDQYLSTPENIEQSDVALRDVTVDGRDGVLGEFTLTWDNEVGAGDTRAIYALVAVDFQDRGVFMGFLGLFGSQEGYYDPALEVLLATEFLDNTEPDPGSSEEADTKV